MLEAIKQRLADHGTVLGWREIATFIYIEDSGESDELLNDRQYNRLKDWRKGINMPSNEKMRHNYLPPCLPLPEFFAAALCAFAAKLPLATVPPVLICS